MDAPKSFASAIILIGRLVGLFLLIVPYLKWRSNQSIYGSYRYAFYSMGAWLSVIQLVTANTLDNSAYDIRYTCFYGGGLDIYWMVGLNFVAGVLLLFSVVLPEHFLTSVSPITAKLPRSLRLCIPKTLMQWIFIIAVICAAASKASRFGEVVLNGTSAAMLNGSMRDGLRFYLIIVSVLSLIGIFIELPFRKSASHSRTLIVEPIIFVGLGVLFQMSRLFAVPTF